MWGRPGGPISFCVPPSFTRSLTTFLLSSALAACSSEPRYVDVRRQPRLVGTELEVFATTPKASTWGPNKRSFAVGIQSELRIANELGQHRIIRSLVCIDDGCDVDTAPSREREDAQIFLVTPKTRAMHVRAELAPEPDEPSSLDRVIPAVDGDLVVLHPGAGPGVPVVSGTAIVWYVGLKEKHVAWDAEQTTISVSPPFTLVGRPLVDDGPDDDAFLRVEIGAPLAERVLNGTVELKTGAINESFALVAVPQADIAALHIAPAPDSLSEQRGGIAQPLDRIASNRIEVPMRRGRKAWLVFETKSGVLGIAGVGDCLPASSATEIFDVGLDDPTLLDIQGKKTGTGELLLAAFDVTDSAQVVVVEEGF